MPAGTAARVASPAEMSAAGPITVSCYRLLPVALLIGLFAGAGAVPADAATAAKPSPRTCQESRATLRCAARHAGLRVGVGHEAGVRADDRLATREFDSVTTENSLQWRVVHPAPGRWDFSGADRTVAWARRNRLRITATHFAWDQILYQSTPAWVKQISGPRRLRAVMARHLRKITRRYGSSIHRWIAVNEPLSSSATPPPSRRTTSAASSATTGSPRRFGSPTGPPRALGWC